MNVMDYINDQVEEGKKKFEERLDRRKSKVEFTGKELKTIRALASREDCWQIRSKIDRVFKSWAEE